MTYLSQSGKTMTPSDYDELCIYNVTPKATTKKPHKETLKTTAYKSKVNYKNCWRQKKGTRNEK